MLSLYRLFPVSLSLFKIKNIFISVMLHVLTSDFFRHEHTYIHTHCCCCFFFHLNSLVLFAQRVIVFAPAFCSLVFFFSYVGLIIMRISSINSIRVEMNLRQGKNEITKNLAHTQRATECEQSNVSKLLLEGSPLAIIITAYHLDGFFLFFSLSVTYES